MEERTAEVRLAQDHRCVRHAPGRCPETAVHHASLWGAAIDVTRSHGWAKRSFGKSELGRRAANDSNGGYILRGHDSASIRSTRDDLLPANCALASNAQD
jgi:hypothetical protein